MIQIKVITTALGEPTLLGIAECQTVEQAEAVIKGVVQQGLTAEVIGEETA